MRQSYRRHKGPLFSEATRLLWAVAERLGSHAEAARQAGCARSDFNRIIFGDKRPTSTRVLAHMQSAWGITIDLWDKPETIEFILPALREHDSGVSLPTETSTGTDD